jgi:hypothetical protein
MKAATLSSKESIVIAHLHALAQRDEPEQRDERRDAEQHRS